MVMDFGGLERNFYFRLFRDFEYSQTSQPMYCMYKARLLEYKWDNFGGFLIQCETAANKMHEFL